MSCNCVNSDQISLSDCGCQARGKPACIKDFRTPPPAQHCSTTPRYFPSTQSLKLQRPGDFCAEAWSGTWHDSRPAQSYLRVSKRRPCECTPNLVVRLRVPGTWQTGLYQGLPNLPSLFSLCRNTFSSRGHDLSCNGFTTSIRGLHDGGVFGKFKCGLKLGGDVAKARV